MTFKQISKDTYIVVCARCSCIENENDTVACLHCCYTYCKPCGQFESGKCGFCRGIFLPREEAIILCMNLLGHVSFVSFEKALLAYKNGIPLK